MKPITVYLPKPYIKDIDKLVSEDHYPNRGETVRLAIRDLLKAESWTSKTEKLNK